MSNVKKNLFSSLLLWLIEDIWVFSVFYRLIKRQKNNKPYKTCKYRNQTIYHDYHTQLIRNAAEDCSVLIQLLHEIKSNVNMNNIRQLGTSQQGCKVDY